MNPAPTTTVNTEPAYGTCEGLPSNEGPACLDACTVEGGITTCTPGCPRFAAIAAACARTAVA